MEEELRKVGQKAIKEHLSSVEFSNNLVEVIRPTYLLIFTNAMNLAAKSLSEEDAKQLRVHDSYNPYAKKLADITAQGLRDRADLQEKKRKFNEWAENVGAGESNTEAQASEGGVDEAEA